MSLFYSSYGFIRTIATDARVWVVGAMIAVFIVILVAQTAGRGPPGG